jgi:hypothetical protein
LTGTTASASDVFIASTPVNSKGGMLRGFEINMQQPFSFLRGIGKNFRRSATSPMSPRTSNI